jgi:hypothetical protein
MKKVVRAVIGIALAAVATAGEAQDSALSRLGGMIVMRCEDGDALCAALEEKTRRLARRDPVAEGRAAAEAGDFRPAGVQAFGPEGGSWDLPGLDCRTAVGRDQVGKWLVYDDYMTQAELRHTEAATRFIERYNRALVGAPAYADKDVCAVKGRRRGEAYNGPIIGYAEAARSRRLDALQALEAAGRTDFAARDRFDRSALAWAVYNGDEAIADWLLIRTQDVSVQEYETPLAAHAMANGHEALAARIVAAAGHPASDTHLCRRELWGGPPEENRGCTWQGVLILKGQWDLLEDFRRRGGNLGYEGAMVLSQALAAGDLETVERIGLLPVPGREPNLMPDRLIADYVKIGAWSLLAGGQPEHFRMSARTPVEAELWAVAAQGRQWEALTFLMDRGADLNLLPAERLATCRVAAGAGDVGGLFACVRDAQAVRERFVAAADVRDVEAAVAIMRAAVDLEERQKAGLAAIAFATGDPAFVGALVEAGLPILIDANPNTGPMEPRSSVRSGGFYNGPLKVEVERWAAQPGHDEALRGLNWEAPIATVIDRQDAAMLAALTRRPVKHLGNLIVFPMERADTADMSYYPGEVDTGALPTRPPERLDALLKVAAPAIMAADGPRGLDAPMRHAISAGWDDVIADWVAMGYRFSEAERPASVVLAWSGFDGQCRPTTARFLAEGGLNWNGVDRADEPPTPIFWSIAATCRDPRTVAALVALGVGDINAIYVNGASPLDEADQRNRDAMAAAIRAAGGRKAVDIDPVRVAALKAEHLLGDDPDLRQTID